MDIPMGQLALRQLPQNHTAAAVGLEWGGPMSDAEATLLVEGQAMIAPDLTTEEIQQLDPFQRARGLPPRIQRHGEYRMDTRSDRRHPSMG